MNKIDIIGDKYGKLKVLKETNERNKHNRPLFECECDCGEIVYKTLNVLRVRKTPSCKTCTSKNRKKVGMANKRNIAGVKFGRLTAVHPTEKRDGRSIIWKCVCDCGSEKEVAVRDLNKGNTESCGCLAKEFMVEKNKKWGLEHRGEKHPSWNPELTEEDRIRNRSGLDDGRVNEWRASIFIRDNRRCQVCNVKNKNLNAHHLDGWNWCKEKRFDTENGITLCASCHRRFHKKYGYGNNTKEQFTEHIKQLNL